MNPRSDLNGFQHTFWAALWAPEPAPASAETLPEWQTQPGWQVYRNTVLKGCVDALQANFPAVTTLVGEACFRACALDYVHAHPPRDRRLLCYGDGFPNFLGRCAALVGLPYLPGVARLDWLWNQSHSAAEAERLWPEDLAGLAAVDLAALRLPLHPATRWAWFADLPIGSLWRAAREHWSDPNPPHWQGDGLLFTRTQDGAVQWQPLSQAAAALLDACARGLPLGVALEQTLEEAPQVAPQTDPDAGTNPAPGPDPAQTLHALLSLGVFCRPTGHSPLCPEYPE